MKPETVDEQGRDPCPIDLDTYLELVGDQEIDFCWFESLFGGVGVGSVTEANTILSNA